MGKGIRVYDFDGTLYPGDSTLHFYGYCLAKQPALIRFLPRQIWGTVRYALGRCTKEQWKEAFFSFLPGIDARAMAEGFWQTRAGKIYPWYLSRQREDDTVISASPEFLLAPVCRRLGIRHLLASPVDPKTGRYQGKNCRGPEKVRRFREAFGDCPVEEFYSDSPSDLPMAAIADRAFFVRNGTPEIWDIP